MYVVTAIPTAANPKEINTAAGIAMSAQGVVMRPNPAMIDINAIA